MRAPTWQAIAAEHMVLGCNKRGWRVIAPDGDVGNSPPYRTHAEAKAALAEEAKRETLLVAYWTGVAEQAEAAAAKSKEITPADRLRLAGFMSWFNKLAQGHKGLDPVKARLAALGQGGRP